MPVTSGGGALGARPMPVLAIPREDLMTTMSHTNGVVALTREEEPTDPLSSMSV